MHNEVLHQHISQQFDKDLENVRSRVLKMGGIVEQQLGHSLKALTDGNIEIAKKVIASEIEVNACEINIDHECTQILARRQPAAGDLRLVMAITKTITDLERIGDEAEKIAKIAIELTKKQNLRSYYIGIKSMGNLVRTMLCDALDAFARMDSQSALDVASKEPESDEQYGAILRQLITYMMEDPRNISGSIDAVWTARSLERIGDHSKNICEHVIYLVEGKDVRHISIEQIQKEMN